ncbi:MAG: hypothetical protein AAGA80_06350 [Cyanobacteria bacterium P01_F01_bin.143]
MKYISEKILIKNLLNNEDLYIDWISLLSQPTTKIWQIPQQIRENILRHLRYSDNDIEKIICFFSLNPEQQIKLLPNLKEQTLFDFSDGDLRTDKTLLVLASEYMDMINSVCLRIMVLDLEDRLIILESAMRDIWSWIDCQDWENEEFWEGESLLTSEWQFVRQLSGFIKQYLNIETTVTKNCLKQIIAHCLHP